MTGRWSYNDLKYVLKQTMLYQEAAFREQVYELHRLYNVQNKLMNELAWENSCGFLGEYAALIVSHEETDVLSRLCSSMERNAQCNDAGPLILNPHVFSGIYTSDGGSESGSSCIEVIDSVGHDENNGVDDLKAAAIPDDEEGRIKGAERIMFCKDINLELPADELDLDAEASSSVDESQANSTGNESKRHCVSNLSYLQVANCGSRQYPSICDFGHNSGLVGYSPIIQACGSSGALSIDLNAPPPIDEPPSMSSDPPLVSAATASSCCVIRYPNESVADMSAELPSNTLIPGRDVQKEDFSYTEEQLPPQISPYFNQNDMEMKQSRSSSLMIDDVATWALPKSENEHANLMARSLVSPSQERVETEMAREYLFGISCKETSIVTSKLLSKEKADASKTYVAEKHHEYDPVSSAGNADIDQVDNHPAVLNSSCDASNTCKSVDVKPDAEQEVKLDNKDATSEEHQVPLEEFQVIQSELFVDKCSIEKLDIFNNQACGCLQEESKSSEDCFHTQKVQQQQELVPGSIIQNAAAALVSISKGKLESISKLSNCSSKCEMMQDESGYSSDSYVSLVLQLPEINPKDCSSVPKPVQMTTTDDNTSRSKLRRTLKNFQTDVLPSLMLLSRHEICEDLRSIEQIRCAGVYENNNGGCSRNSYRLTRSKRSRHY